MGILKELMLGSFAAILMLIGDKNDNQFIIVIAAILMIIVYLAVLVKLYHFIVEVITYQKRKANSLYSEKTAWELDNEKQLVKQARKELKDNIRSKTDGLAPLLVAIFFIVMFILIIT